MRFSSIVSWSGVEMPRSARTSRVTHLSEGYTFADADSKVMKLPEGTELLGYFKKWFKGRQFAALTEVEMNQLAGILEARKTRLNKSLLAAATEDRPF